MFYEWIYPLHEQACLSVLNVFRYITFRSAYAAVTALLISFLFGPIMIEWLRSVKLGQRIRQEGPQSHLGKAGTMGLGLVGLIRGGASRFGRMFSAAPKPQGT